MVRKPCANTEDRAGLILGLGRSSGEEKPGGLQSIGSQRVRHNFRDIAYLALVP